MKNKAIMIVLMLVMLCVAACCAEGAIDPASVTVGDIVTFGSYEQDNNISNGREPIEWIVLDIQDGKALLLSKFGLDAMPYEKLNRKTTWKMSDIRYWLICNFVYDAFKKPEQQAVMETEIDNSIEQGYQGIISGDCEENLIDSAFILSYHEAYAYFPDDNSRICEPTPYAIAQGAWETEKYGSLAVCWWLRTPGEQQTKVGYINYTGQYKDGVIYNIHLAVRPAIWIDLNADIFK